MTRPRQYKPTTQSTQVPLAVVTEARALRLAMQMSTPDLLQAAWDYYYNSPQILRVRQALSEISGIVQEAKEPSQYNPFVPDTPVSTDSGETIAEKYARGKLAGQAEFHRRGAWDFMRDDYGFPTEGPYSQEANA